MVIFNSYVSLPEGNWGAPSWKVIFLGWVAQENDDGIAKTFDFASTRNKAVTGPLPRFAHMIHAGYLVISWYLMGVNHEKGW
jgi:hypothetical protein